MPDDVLVRFRDGDVDALAAVYDRYRRAVWSVALRVTRTDHLAQEAMQETFVRAWQAAATYDVGRPLGPWLMTIARRVALDVLRRELRPTRGAHAEEQDAMVEGPGIDEVWLTWQVQEALRRLNDEEREIVRLAFFEDLTQAQISQRLSIPVGTVKSRSHRAHRRLADLLAHVREGVGEPAASTPNRGGGRGRTPGGAGSPAAASSPAAADVVEGSDRP